MNEQGYYCIIPAKVLADARLKLQARLLYGVITSFTTQSGLCWASNETLAKRMPTKIGANGQTEYYAPESVSRLVSSLVKLGYFEVRTVKHQRGETRYLALRGENIDSLMNARGLTVLSSGLDETGGPLDEMIKPGLDETVKVVLKDISIHTQGETEKNLPDPYVMIKQRLALAPRALKDKWTAKGLTGEPLANLIDTFATKEVAKLKGDAWEVAQEVERLCQQPNHWPRLFTSAYANNYTAERGPKQAQGQVYVRPKTNPTWR